MCVTSAYCGVMIDGAVKTAQLRTASSKLLACMRALTKLKLCVPSTKGCVPSPYRNTTSCGLALLLKFCKCSTAGEDGATKDIRRSTCTENCKWPSCLLPIVRVSLSPTPASGEGANMLSNVRFIAFN